MQEFVIHHQKDLTTPRCIINIISVATVNPPLQWSAYVSAKSGLLGLSKALALELGPQGIRVNCISPSLIKTELTAFIPDRVKDVLAKQNPLRRNALPQDIAKTALFLASEDASFITGEHILVSGGSTLK